MWTPRALFEGLAAMFPVCNLFNVGSKEFESMYNLVLDGLISLHVQKEGEAHITRCITMKKNSRSNTRTLYDNMHLTNQTPGAGGGQVICV